MTGSAGGGKTFTYTAESDELGAIDAVSRTFLSRCQRLRRCGFAPNCVCDVDPTDPRDVAAALSSTETRSR